MNIIFITRSTLAGKVIAVGLHKEIPLRAILVEDDLNLKKHFHKSVTMNLRGYSLVDKIVYVKRRYCKAGLLFLKKYGIYVDPCLVNIIDEEVMDNAQKILSEGQDIRKINWPNGVDIYRPKNINSKECQEMIELLNADLIVVFGCSILNKNIYELARLGAVNAHSSILPDYKGYFAEFWQVLNNDFQSVGITIHWLSEKVDSGDIIYQQKVTIPHINIDPNALYAINALEIRNVYGKICKTIIEKTGQRKKQSVSSVPINRAKDITTENKIKLYRKIGYLK